MGARNSKRNFKVNTPVEKSKIETKPQNQSYKEAVIPEEESVVNNNVEVKENEEEVNNPTPVPEWITEEYFVDILKENVENFDRITSFKAYPALSAGENYATLMLRVRIDMQLKDNSSKQKSFMLKVAHDSEQMKQMMEAFNFFLPENEMYSEVIPEMEEMYKAAGVEVYFAARNYKFTKDPGVHTVLLEDLSPRGFKNTNRLDCLDMEHTHAVLKKMAQFHAASAARVAIKGPYKDIIMNPLAGKDQLQVQQMFDMMLSSGRTSFLENIGSIKDGDKFKDAFKNYFKTFSEEMWTFVMYDPNEFNVLNHGDAWSNNILFKYDNNGGLEETFFVDFQNSRFHSPVSDLYYFILSSVRREYKLKDFDHFIRYYYDNLIENLQILNYPKPLPSLRDMHAKLYKYSTMAVMTATLTLPVVLLDKTDNAKIDNFLNLNEEQTQESANFQKAMYTSTRYREYMADIMPWLYNRGLLEPFHPLPQKEQTENVVQDASTKSIQSATGIPAWIDEEVFHKILSANVADFKEIKSFAVSPGTKPGDNYASMMLKVDVDLVKSNDAAEKLSFMLKVPPPGEQSAFLINLMHTFTREVTFYTTILEQLEELYKANGLEIRFGPRLFNVPEEVTKDVVLLENLSVHGFKNADRQKGLNEAHTKAALTKLAQFHAASAYIFAVKEQMPEIFLKNIYNEDNREIMTNFMKVFSASFVDAISTFEGNEEYKDKIIKLLDESFDILSDLNKYNPEDFNVLLHGDFWLNNIMFQYKPDGNINDVYFVDYQITHIGNPSHDLLYFATSSIEFDEKLSQFDEYINHYYNNLVKNLEMLKYPKKIPTLKELHVDLIRQGFLGLIGVNGPLIACCMQNTENATMENLIENSEAAAKLKFDAYNNPLYKKRAAEALTWLNHRGVFDRNEVKLQENSAFQAPTWVDEAHFVGILEDTIDNFAEILELIVKPATISGENYASQLLKVEIKIKLRDGSIDVVSYILKVSLASASAEIITDWDFFKKETTMYRDYIPDFERYYKRAGSEINFGPKSYQFKKDPGCEYVLMENLHLQGFSNVNRMVGLDMTHTKEVLRKMAQFHAASVKRMEEKGPYEDCFKKNMYSEESRKFFDSMPKYANEAFLDCVAKFKNNTAYIDKMKPFMDILIDGTIKAMEFDPNDFNVLNHGDLWVNNIMFQYNEEGAIKNTYFVDFQVSNYGSPAIDLWYFLISSVAIDIKVKHFNDFIAFYHENLVENMKLLQCTGKIPTLSDIHDVLNRKSFLGLNTFNGVLSVCLVDPSQNANIESFIADTKEARDFRHSLYSNERFEAQADLILNWFNELGYLNF